MGLLLQNVLKLCYVWSLFWITMRYMRGFKGCKSWLFSKSCVLLIWPNRTG